MVVQSVATFGYVLAMIAARPELWFLPDLPAAWFLGSRVVWGRQCVCLRDGVHYRCRRQRRRLTWCEYGVNQGGILFGFPPASSSAE